MYSNIPLRTIIIVLALYLVGNPALAIIVNNNNKVLAVSAYDSGYKHGYSDGSHHNENYLIKSGGPNAHTSEFMRGYQDGFNKALKDTNGDQDEIVCRDFMDAFNRRDKAAMKSLISPNDQASLDSFADYCGSR